MKACIAHSSSLKSPRVLYNDIIRYIHGVEKQIMQSKTQIKDIKTRPTITFLKKKNGTIIV